MSRETRREEAELTGAERAHLGEVLGPSPEHVERAIPDRHGKTVLREADGFSELEWGRGKHELPAGGAGGNEGGGSNSTRVRRAHFRLLPPFHTVCRAFLLRSTARQQHTECISDFARPLVPSRHIGESESVRVSEGNVT